MLLLGMPLAGILVGWAGARAINRAIERGFLTHEFCNIYLLSLAFIAYLAADQIGGNGFIAAFTAGVATGNTLKHINEEIYELVESEGQLLNPVIFFLFGVALLPLVWGLVSWSVVVYALLSLTLALSILLHGLTALPGVNAYAAALRICARRGDDLSSEQTAVAAMPLRLSPNLALKNNISDALRIILEPHPGYTASVCKNHRQDTRPLHAQVQALAAHHPERLRPRPDHDTLSPSAAEPGASPWTWRPIGSPSTAATAEAPSYRWPGRARPGCAGGSALLWQRPASSWSRSCSPPSKAKKVSSIGPFTTPRTVVSRCIW
jgi:hypothetical protein